MKTRLFVLAAVLAVLAGLGIHHTAASTSSDADEIKAMIEANYVNGAFNALDPDGMRRGFHPDFAIFSPNGEELRKYPIADWAERTAKRKASADFDPAQNQWDHHFATVDVTGRAAAVKIELSKGGTLVYTDYLSLLKFDSGWRIVAKVYHQHDS